MEEYGQSPPWALEIHFSLYIELLILLDSSEPLFLRKIRKVIGSTVILVARVLSASVDIHPSPPLLPTVILTISHDLFSSLSLRDLSPCPPHPSQLGMAASLDLQLKLNLEVPRGSQVHQLGFTCFPLL